MSTLEFIRVYFQQSSAAAVAVAALNDLKIQLRSRLKALIVIYRIAYKIY